MNAPLTDQFIYSWLGRSVHGSYTFVTASYSFLAKPACVFVKGDVLHCLFPAMNGHTLSMRVACQVCKVHLCSTCEQNSKFGPTDGRSSTKLPCTGTLCRQGTAALAHNTQSDSKACLPIKVVCCRPETAAFCWLQTACVRCVWQLPAACRTPPPARRQWPAVKKLQATLTPLLGFHLKGPSLLGLSQTQKPSPSPQVYSSNLCLHTQWHIHSRCHNSPQLCKPDQW